jgi:type II secretory pathway pseudopilin PulG
MMKSILARSQAAKAKFAAAKSRGLKEALRSPAGAIDLASIMVGVLVIGIIGGVIAVAVFAVIPWAQDEAAKGALESVKTAESVAFAANSSDGKAEFSTLAQLNDGNTGSENVIGASSLLQSGGNVDISLSTNSKAYVASVESDSGKTFVILSNKPTEVLKAGDPAIGTFVAANAGTVAPTVTE